MSHRLPADQFVVGLVLNVLVLGLVGFLAARSTRSPKWCVAFGIPSDLAASRCWARRSSTNRGSLYLVYPLVPFVWWLLFRTRWGLGDPRSR